MVCLASVLLVALGAWYATVPCPAAAQERLFEAEPYDLITLDEFNNNAVLKVQPLKFANRRIPKDVRPSDAIRIWLVDQPETSYNLQWHSIAQDEQGNYKIDLFEQLILKKANQLVARGQTASVAVPPQPFEPLFDQAYEYFEYLLKKDPELPGLDVSIEDYLYTEAGAWLGRDDDAVALALLWELHRRNPADARLEKALGVTVDKLLTHYEGREDYRPLRQLLGKLADRYPQHATVARWESKLKGLAGGELAKARSELEAGRLPEAAAAGRRVAHVWPDLPGARELIEAIHVKHPRVVVGVTVPTASGLPGRLDDWASGRSSRLLYRTLAEFVGPGPEGGTYDCPVGEKEIEEFDNRLSFQIDPDIHWSTGEATLTGYDVSRRLLAMADPGGPPEGSAWRELLQSVSVDQVYGVKVQLRHRHLRPDALLQTLLIPYSQPYDPDVPPPPNGPFHVDEDRSGDGETCYVANSRYFAAGSTQPGEIVERHFARGKDAIAALRRGEIDLLDRVNPWDIATLKRAEGISVEPYAVPRIHCLIPNTNKPLLANRTFRRALVYGIYREAILRKQLSAGLELPGCQVVSGPFPLGVSGGDLIGYAYDENIEPRTFEPHVAIALAAIASKELELAEAQRREKEGLQPETPAPKAPAPEEPAAGGDKKPPQVPRPSLVLAHPPHEVARMACKAIKRQLHVIGVDVELHELEPGESGVSDDRYDLVYAELAVWEPLVDARRLLGPGGATGRCSSYMSLALRRLDETVKWQTARKQLQRIHRITHDEVTIIPLWQLTDHFARREDLGGMGTSLVWPYQNIEQWQLSFRSYRFATRQP